MKVIKPYIEIIDAPEYHTMLTKLEAIGRTCYKSESKDAAEKFIRNIIKSGHESVIEHQDISVRVICDRGVSHEIVRHRLASYSQESTRYCNYSRDKFGGVTFIDPRDAFGWNDNTPRSNGLYYVWEKAMDYAESAYMQLLSSGASPQEARDVLPNSVKTEIVMTMNMREWRHFLKLRTAKASHPQMREIADKILRDFKIYYPVFFEDFE